MSDQKVVAIIQARMSSSRLPGKVLLDIEGKPMLQWVVERVKQAKKIDDVVVATTDNPADEPIEDFCKAHGVAVYRGNQFDVLDRYYQAARQDEADVIVRITADCPLIDPGEIDILLDEFKTRKVDFAANRLPPPWHRTFPIGLDVEIASFSALERAWKEAVEKHDREHVMPYLYEVEGRFGIYYHNTKPDHGEIRWTVDTQQDIDAVRMIYRSLPDKEHFSWHDVLHLVQEHPDLSALNAGVRHKSFNEVDERMLKSKDEKNG
jgi:spore coat polysaccharide biosynthesis protein SpsF